MKKVLIVCYGLKDKQDVVNLYAQTKVDIIVCTKRKDINYLNSSLE